MNTTLRFALGWGLAFAAMAAVAQQKAGEIGHLQGMATAQQPGAQFRFLGRGDPVLQGDVITTTDKGFAVVNLADGTRFTLRPSTTFALERYAHDQGTETALMRLVKGGMRVVTGLIGKRNPGGIELRVNTATIGIRGTSFDARLCAEDCRQEGVAPVASTAAEPNPLGPVIARVVQSAGNVAAAQPGKAARPLAVGAPLYEGDDLRTGAGSMAVIGFRDQARVSVNPDTTMRIASYVYNRPQAADGMALTLLKGGLRVFTGLIGKKDSNAFTIRTRTSTIGIRGTGMDISCEGPCVDDSLGAQPSGAAPDPVNPAREEGLFMLTWEGATFFLVGPLDVPLDKAGFVGRDGLPRVLATVPVFFADFGSPRPDQVPIDWDNLFASSTPTGADGLYVYVRDGHVVLGSRNAGLDLGVGEPGYVGPNGNLLRLSSVPGFISTDPYPIPELFSESDRQVFRLFGVTLGQPGQEICRL